MNIEDFKKAKYIVDDIEANKKQEVKIHNLYKLNKSKNLTSEDIIWLLEYASMSNTFINERLNSDLNKI